MQLYIAGLKLLATNPSSKGRNVEVSPIQFLSEVTKSSKKQRNVRVLILPLFNVDYVSVTRRQYNHSVRLLRMIEAQNSRYPYIVPFNEGTPGNDTFRDFG